MADILEELWGDLSAAKIAYSIILLALIWLLGRELIRVWWDPQLYVGTSKYFKNGQPDAGRVESFIATLLAQHFKLRSELEAEHRSRAQSKDRPEEVLRTWPVAAGSISLPPDVKNLELKINGFDVGGLLATLRGWISQPNEVLVTVQTRTFGGGRGDVERVDTDVTWLRAPRLEKDKPTLLQHFNSWGAKTDDEAATLLAASLIWADAAERNSELLKVGRQNFSDWAYAWLQYRIINYEGATPGKLDETQEARLSTAGERVAPLLKDDAYPEVWRLAADLVTLYPESIPGGDAKTYRQHYLKALGIEEPTVARAEAIERPLSQFMAGSLIWGPSRESAVRFTCVVQDQTGKRFLLLPDLITNQAPLPVDLYMSLGSTSPVARVTRRISADGISLALAEPIEGLAVSNGAIKDTAKLPTVGQTVKLIPSNKTAAITRFGARLPSIDTALIEVKPKITGAGDSGAPVLDSSGNLVAMGYAGTDKASYLAPLHDLFEQEKLTLPSGP